MSYAEHNMIRRGRIGVGATSATDIDAQWVAGVNSMSYQEASNLRAETEAAIAAGWYEPSAAAKASIAKWDAYVAKLNVVSKLTPEQYRAQQSKGTLLDRLTGGKGGGIVSSALGFFGLGGQAQAPKPVAKPSGGGFLDAVLSPVGLVIGVGVTAAGAYAASQSKGKRKGARRR